MSQPPEVIEAVRQKLRSAEQSVAAITTRIETTLDTLVRDHAQKKEGEGRVKSLRGWLEQNE